MTLPGMRNARLPATPGRWGHWLAVLCLCALSAQAAELAQLANGYSLRCERHERSGENTRLYLDASGSGFVDLPTASISGFEPAAELPAVAASAADIHEHIARAGARIGIDPDFIHSVIKAESGYNAAAVSPKGAQGLMQLMPATASRLGVNDSFDPAANVEGGTRYLRELLLRYNGDAQKALAAYNAGPERVEQYKGVPPYRETRSYVSRVINDFNRRKLTASSPQAKPPRQTAGATPQPVAVSQRKSRAKSQPAKNPRKPLNPGAAKTASLASTASLPPAVTTASVKDLPSRQAKAPEADGGRSQ